jgi:hypothetical protein
MMTWFLKAIPWHYVPRRLMPQIDEADLTALAEWLAWRGVKMTDTVVRAEQLQFRQKVDFNKVKTMPPAVYAKPVLISNDYAVLDGNHRSWAHKLKGDPESAMMIDLPFAEAIGALFSFCGTYSYSKPQLERN